MAEKIGEARLTFGVDDRPLKAGLEGARREIDTFGAVVATKLGQIGATIAGGAFLQSSFQAASNLETITRKLTNTLGENGTAGALNFIRETAGRTGLSFTNLADGFSRFTAAASAAGVPLRDQERLFAAVAKAGQAYGLSNDEVAGSLLALQQIAAKGVVQSEELRGQLGERLPVALSATAKGLGLTVQELQKLVESGKLTSQQFFPAFTNGLEQLTASAGASQTAAQALTQLNDAWTQLQVVVGESFLPAAVGTIRELTGFAEGLAIALGNSTETGRATQELRDVQKLIGIIKGDIEARKELKLDTSAAISQLEELERRASLLQQQLDRFGRVEQIKKEAVELKQLELSYQRQGLAVDAVREKQAALARELFTLTGSTAPVKAGQIFNGLLTDVVTITPTATTNLKEMREEVGRLEVQLSKLRGQESAGIAKGANVTGITEQRAKVEQELIRLNRDLKIEAGDTGALLEKQREEKQKQAGLDVQAIARQREVVQLQRQQFKDAQALVGLKGLQLTEKQEQQKVAALRRDLEKAESEASKARQRINGDGVLTPEAVQAIGKVEEAGNNLKLALLEGSLRLEEAAKDAALRFTDAVRQLTDARLNLADQQTNPEGLNRFLRPDEQFQRNRQAILSLGGELRKSLETGQGLLNAQGVGLGRDVFADVRRIFDDAVTGRAASRDGFEAIQRTIRDIQNEQSGISGVNDAQEALTSVTSELASVNSTLAARVQELVQKAWAVQVVVAADGASQVYGDAVNAAL